MQELTKLAENDAGEIRQGLGAISARSSRKGSTRTPSGATRIYKIARFTTTKHPDGDRTLEAYVKDLRENQTAIYYLTGDDAKRLAASPQLEGFRARGVEVLLLADPVDAFWVSTAAGFDGKPFKSISQGAADIKLIPLAEGATRAGGSERRGRDPDRLLSNRRSRARSRTRARPTALTDSVACLVAPEFGPDRQLERMLAAHGRVSERVKPVLEVNATHPLTSRACPTVQGAAAIGRWSRMPPGCCLTRRGWSTAKRSKTRPPSRRGCAG